MKAEKADMMPTFLTTTAMRMSTVLLTPRSVGAESVMTSPTPTLSRSACPWKSSMVLGLASSSRLPPMGCSTRLTAGSLAMSTPPSTRSIEALSETALAQPRPRTVK